MLVLTRRTKERLMIGDDIIVTILSSEHNYVRIGFEAPLSVSIKREELYIKDKNKYMKSKNDSNK